MARSPRKRGDEPDKPDANAGAGKKPRRREREPGTETTPDTRLVNASESDPAFYHAPLEGQTLGKCRIQKLLGEGRTAVVYRAVYEPLNRTVAVKVLQENMKQLPSVLRVFQQEGRAVAALDHENVLKIYDVGEDRGNHYLVLELLHGKTLHKRIEESEGGVLPVADAIEFARQAASGLAAAHRKNLVHRDIKPENLVVEPDGTLKIVDFGLAAEAEGAFSGGRLGTPHYMAPEVCRGESAGTPSDIYSLGITLFHALVGQPPHAGRHTTEEIVEQHLKGARLEPEKLRPDLPRVVCELVRRMTRFDPTARLDAKGVLDVIAKITPGRLAARVAGGAGRAGRPGRAARRAGTQAGPAAQPWIVIGCVVVAAIVVLLMMMQGGDDEEGGRVVAQPPVETETPVEPERPPEKVDAGVQSELERMLGEARHEEKTQNFLEALRMYRAVLMRAPATSQEYREAKAAYEALRAELENEAGLTERGNGAAVPRPRRIGVEESEEAGREFAGRMDEFLEHMRLMDLEWTKGEVTAYVDRTRPGSPERVAIETLLRRVGYLESLLTLAASRAGTLPETRSQWANYDPMASGDLVVTGLDSAGVHVRDTMIDKERILGWAAIPQAILINFLDELRNETSASETFCLGYYCLLLGDPRADQYFGFCRLLDDSPEMRRQIEDLRDSG